MSSFKIVAGDWESLSAEIKSVREQVFIIEQHIAPEDEWDAEDAISLHFAVYEQQQVIATARLLANHSIGRVAVLKAYRGRGVGKQLMLKIIEQAKLQDRSYVKLSAQVHAISFYAGLGFKLEGEQYLDCGITHVDMRLYL